MIFCDFFHLLGLLDNLPTLDIAFDRRIVKFETDTEFSEVRIGLKLR